MANSRHKPCCICRRWFLPDVRVGNRQRTCGRPECKDALRKKNQSSWRRQNPDYFVAWRIQMRAASERRPEDLRFSPPLQKLPWDIAQDEFGAKGADFIGSMGKLLLQTAKSQLKGQIVDSTQDIGTLSLPPAKSQFSGQLIDST
jgi:hypothetical protein